MNNGKMVIFPDILILDLNYDRTLCLIKFVGLVESASCDGGVGMAQHFSVKWNAQFVRRPQSC